jgi:uncharacterized protein (DUF1810 family)
MDRYELARFRDAQRGVYETARAEMQAGRKRSHWMWFVFPQLRGLGSSEMARFYGIESRVEAQAFLADPELGGRLVEMFEIVAGLNAGSARDIFGAPDDLTVRSCATLFASLPGACPIFAQVLQRYFAGFADERTLALLGSGR